MLDDIVFSSALAQARRLMDRGHDAESAAEQACPGAWTVYRKRVLDGLRIDGKLNARDDAPSPPR